MSELLMANSVCIAAALWPTDDEPAATVAEPVVALAEERLNRRQRYMRSSRPSSLATTWTCEATQPSSEEARGDSLAGEASAWCHVEKAEPTSLWRPRCIPSHPA